MGTYEPKDVRLQYNRSSNTAFFKSRFSNALDGFKVVYSTRN